MKYAKAVVAGVYLVAGIVVNVLTDDVFALDEWVTIVTSLATAVVGVVNVAKVENARTE